MNDNIKEILALHQLWINGDSKGIRANLSKADLSGAYLNGADLSGAYLNGANLSGAYLNGAYLNEADLNGADLSGAYLNGANLSGAYLNGANLSGANLSGAYLNGADLNGADLSGAEYNYLTVGINLACPEKGAFTAFKNAHGKIIELEVPSDAKRSSATTRKIRVSKALVMSIDGGKAQQITSNYDRKFVYEVGKMAEASNFDDNRWNECSNGIHCFLTRHEAEMWE
jgi:uncharacterized protein YjbI with pentapeptide repeats